MRLFRGRWIFLLAGGLALVGLLNCGIGFLALKRLEKKAGAPIRGTFLPYPFLPRFVLKNSSLNWQGRFQVLSGTVHVRYDPFFLLPGWRFRTRISGWNLAVRFSGDLAASQGISEVKVDWAEADFAFFEKGDPEIFLFDVQSPQIHFHVVKEEGPRTEN